MLAFDDAARSRYVAPVAVLDAQVTLEPLYGTIRFHLDHPYWLSHLTDNELSVVEDDQSTLSVNRQKRATGWSIRARLQ